MIVSSPGRICLFGEHQDYLGLPVIAAAVSLRLTVEADKRDDLSVSIALPDVGEEDSFSMEGDLPYTKPADYFRSGINTMRKDGFTFSGGVDATVTGEIPIQAGTSSSSAMVVSWINLLAHVSDQDAELTPEQIADLAYRAEVEEFSEAGGMMDQYASAVGGVIYVESEPAMKVESLPCRLGAFVLGDSLEKKDTQAVLSRSKERVVDLVATAQREVRGFSLQDATVDEVAEFDHLEAEEKSLLAETLTNRDITAEGVALLREEAADSQKLGTLLNRQHAILRDALGISTKKIDGMLEASLAAGATGGKINGSGGGGCMFAYAPDCAEEVASAVEKAGGRAYVVSVDEGTRKEN